MVIFGHLLLTLAQVVDFVLWAYAWVVLGRVVISFVNADYKNPIVRFIRAVTEPVLKRVRRLPVCVAGFDLSPIAVWIVIILLQRFVVRSLVDLAHSL
jgi:YggT family protein